MVSSFVAMFVLAVGAPKPIESLDFDKPLAPSDYEGRSLRELTIMRNVPFARAGNPFRRMWLDAYFRKQDWYSSVELDESRVTVAGRANASAVATYEASLTKEQLMARRDAVRARIKTKPTPEDELELRLLSVRFGGWAGEGPAPADLSPLENPARLDKLLMLTELDGLSPRDLKLLRNAVFARRGRPFKTPLVQGHFKTVLWYTPDPAYTDSRLTEIDKKNVQLILSLEKQLNRNLKPDDGPDQFYERA
jgi:hypothetical protein